VVTDSGDKRFDATPSRRRRARREGNVARSGELTSLAAFGAATLAAAAAVPAAAEAAFAAVRGAAVRPVGGGIAPAIAGIALAGLVPALAAACAASTVALAQGGGLHVTGLHVDVKRLNVVAGLKRMLGGEALVGIVRAALAFGVVLLAMLPLASDIVGAGAAVRAPGGAASLVVSAAFRACCASLAVGAVFALADYALARRRWLRSLKMSFDELKRDAKENDGDPQVRARRKSAYRAVVRGAIGRTCEASFVVVNPEHVAIAIRYTPPDVPVPQILVRALDDAALRVKALAREHRIPIVEDVALARLLFAHGESGRAIPPETYVAVAQIIAALAREGVLA
jgi:flagellar biosynthetic protein FlhB